ncbi:MAG TPA: M20 family metallo-hydrolase [Verrucomicrobiae bacterium]|jgi:N-carbamoyl-L-amino-acid hydrolase|nr:M20 family metallo-hydrolase [Verrucomicrobiae bacterium]
MKPLQVNITRLQKEIDELALITEVAPPVVTRILFSEADLRGRAFVKNLCREAGLKIREDAVGNIFARWEGAQKNLPAVATGSHIDAIPNSGKYDGVVGVLGAIEAIRALKKSGFQPKRSIELIVFTAEEPTRFGVGCLGSRLLSGVLSSKKAPGLKDRDGENLEFWRKRGGCKGKLDSVKLPKNFYSAFIELHIEQGPVLEKEKISIGIVEKIAAPSTLRLQLTGVGGHAGATLMPARRDALLAGAEIALAVEKIVSASGSRDTVGTTGIFRIEPGAVNSVPCKAYLEIDLRDTQVATRDAALKQIKNAAREICSRRKIKSKIELLNLDPPAICDSKLVEMISEICRAQKISCKKTTSRAYHDSLFMAQICPTTMIFIPCRKGYSHRPDEFSSSKQIEKGIHVLAETLAVSVSMPVHLR